MNFNSAAFLAFLVLVYGAHLAIPRGLWRFEKILLLAASYLFYAWWRADYAILLLVSTAIDYACGRYLAKANRFRGLGLAGSVAANLGLLGFFKYGDFVLGNVEELAGWFGLGFERPAWSFLLPVGISFYTFQSMSYSIDVYRRRLEPLRSFSDFALFVSFFPQLVAGPIVRASEFVGQLGRKRAFRWPRLSWGLFLVLLGYFHKSVLADNLAGVSDGYFDGTPHGGESFLVAWLGVYAFAGQIYCDFAGYSLIATGVACLFGFRFPANFDYPYLATSFRDFWRRWHMTLSRFLRDYLYVPLGGNRGGRLATARNLLLTMALGGLWHGASWNFVLWGLVHGLFLAVERWAGPALAPLARRLPFRGRSASFLKGLAVFHGVSLAWVLFRARGVGDAVAILRAMLGNLHFENFSWIPGYDFLAVVAGLHVVRLARTRFGGAKRPAFGWCLASSALMIVALLRMRGTASAFIYFQF